jgi:hypothetical protein
MQSTATRPIRTPSIAPTFPQSTADVAAHRAAEYRRGDSDPSMDEALRRVRDHGRAIRDGLAEYEAWAGSAA